MSAVVEKPRHHSVSNGKKRCIVCNQRKLVECFDEYSYTTNQGKRSRRLESRCKACNEERRRQRYERDKVAANLNTKRWHAAHKVEVATYRAKNIDAIRRSRVRSEQRRRAARAMPKSLERHATTEAKEMYRIGNKYIDVYDGVLIDNPTIDHVVPLSAKGDHTVDNLAPTSYRNNSSKKALPMLVWMANRAREAQ